MMRVCQKNTCPVGVATQDPELRKRFTGKPEYVINFLRFIAQDMREMMAKLGFRTVDEMIGRVDKLERQESAMPIGRRKVWICQKFFIEVDMPSETNRYQTVLQDHGLEQRFDQRVLLDLCRPALDEEEKVEATLPIRNTDRAVGTMVGSEISRRYGATGLAGEYDKDSFPWISRTKLWRFFAPRDDLLSRW